MRISDLSIRRPVLTAVVFIFIIIMGLVSVTRLGLDLYPDLNFPVAAVVVNYEGVGPQEIENLITRPVEQAMGTVNNIDHITSESQPGSSLVLVWFKWGTDMSEAAIQMREKLDRIKPVLPRDADTPMVLKMDPTQIPILQLGVTGGKDLADLQQIVEDKIQPRLERLEGVASVVTTGGYTREILVQLDSNKLQQYGLNSTQIAGILRQENLSLASGELTDGGKILFVRTLGEFRSIDQLANLPIPLPQGGTIALKDLALVKDSNKKVRQYTRINGKPSIGIHILKQTGTNIVQVADRVNAELEQLQKELKADGVQISIAVDNSKFIRDSINQIKQHSLEGAVLSIIVLLLFLRNWRSTIIVGLAIPISVVSTFVLLYLKGITLNMMSLGGLALGIGRMVDDSIVVLENIYRHRERGLSLIEAARQGAAEVSNAVIAATLTAIAVFLPMIFVEGIAAELFRQMALTVSFSLLCSLLVSLMLVPMLSSRFLRLEQEKNRHVVWWDRMLNWFSAGLSKLDDRYRDLLAWSLGHRKTVVLLVIGLLVASGALVPVIGMEFMPKTDTGEIAVDIKLAKGTILEKTAAVAEYCEQKARELPETKVIFTSVGPSGRGGMVNLSGQSENAQIRIKVGARSERQRSTDEIVEDLRRRIGVVPGAKISVKMSDASQGGPAGAPIQINIKGQDLEELARLADEVVKRVKQVPGTREVESNLEASRPELQIYLKREVAAQYGLTATQVASAVHQALAGETATRFRTGKDEIDVRLALEDSYAESLGRLAALPLSLPGGGVVALGQVADLSVTMGPTSIKREENARVVTVSAENVGRDLGSVTKDIQKALADLRLPPDYTLEYGGQNKEMMQSFASLAQALVLAIILVYLVMAAQFESFLYPFIIMFSLPTTFIGVVAGLALTGRAFSVNAFIGVIMLVGIVVSNAIVLVDYINILRERGKDRWTAILEAGHTRLRPILMTTLTTVLGMIPLALGIGEGAEAEAPLATVVVGGLTTSTILTLVFVPVVYTLFDDVRNWRFKKSKIGGNYHESKN
ncbi:efflux RND transporter permease subunit [Carboxydocella sp. ULO1]|uniref:efflux RND transporter permease subunit n=1 Tax=Carboxydocella sp. ULO1 TaxID=1926599 RepID=UPI0009AEE184|nr:efflux RND transporter permease subunit [Carboxydocella sp. ULO1]GAW29482.1 multidrug ABC transporter [Carboxydocella sp. ULO1]